MNKKMPAIRGLERYRMTGIIFIIYVQAETCDVALTDMCKQEHVVLH